MGNINLLWVVNESKAGLAKGGWTRLNTLESQPTKYLIMHGTILDLMVAYSASIFQLKVRQNHHNKGPKRDAKVKKNRFVLYISR